MILPTKGLELLKYYYTVCVRTTSRVELRGQRVEDRFSPTMWTRLVRVDSKYRYPLSHLQACKMASGQWLGP